jgi:hypothetical protein
LLDIWHCDALGESCAGKTTCQHRLGYRSDSCTIISQDTTLGILDRMLILPMKSLLRRGIEKDSCVSSPLEETSKTKSISS